MRKTIVIKQGKIEAVATDKKAGYTLKIRVLNSDIETDAGVLDLRDWPCRITFDFEEPLTLEPAIDYSDIDPDGDFDNDDETED